MDCKIIYYQQLINCFSELEPSKEESVKESVKETEEESNEISKKSTDNFTKLSPMNIYNFVRRLYLNGKFADTNSFIYHSSILISLDTYLMFAKEFIPLIKSFDFFQLLNYQKNPRFEMYMDDIIDIRDASGIYFYEYLLFNFPIEHKKFVVGNRKGLNDKLMSTMAFTSRIFITDIYDDISNIFTFLIKKFKKQINPFLLIDTNIDRIPRSIDERMKYVPGSMDMLSYACFLNIVPLVAIIIENYKKEYLALEKHNAFHIACSFEYFNLTEYLLNEVPNMCDVNTYYNNDSIKRTPLMTLLECGVTAIKEHRSTSDRIEKLLISVVTKTNDKFNFGIKNEKDETILEIVEKLYLREIYFEKFTNVLRVLMKVPEKAFFRSWFAP